MWIFAYNRNILQKGRIVFLITCLHENHRSSFAVLKYEMQTGLQRSESIYFSKSMVNIYIIYCICYCTKIQHYCCHRNLFTVWWLLTRTMWFLRSAKSNRSLHILGAPHTEELPHTMYLNNEIMSNLMTRNWQ